MVVSDYVASLSMRPGGKGEWVHFYTDLIEDCLIQDEASLSDGATSLFPWTPDGWSASLEVTLKKYHR